MNRFLILISLLLTFLLGGQSPHRYVAGAWERPEVKFPTDNPYSEASVALGNALFFNSLLSSDSSISCQSCHRLTLALADHLPQGEGIKGRHVDRNTPTLFNVGFHPYFMMDGKFSSLEEQALAPIKEHREMDMLPEKVVQRLQVHPRYDEMSIAAYGEPFSVPVMQKALANFQRMLISDNARFDQFMRQEIMLTKQELKGWELFQSERLHCIQCHSGYNFTNYAFENNGLYKAYEDQGRYRITGKEKDRAKFKVPTLRNIAITYPYMHNGSVATLEAVIDHYAAGGKDHPSKSPLVQGFALSEEERSSLLAFLNTLTDQYLLAED